MRHTYTLQILIPHSGEWFGGAGSECSREYGMGYLQAHREAPTPRLGMRLIREDGKVLDDVKACDEVRIGAVVGFPTWQQYARAAHVALIRAGQIVDTVRDVDDPLAGIFADRLAGIRLDLGRLLDADKARKEQP
jgi:hypothetical protein